VTTRAAETPDDQALVARAREGDDEAFARLFRSHHVRVYNLARYLVRDATEAEDVTQAAFIRAWHELPKLRDPGAFAAWINRIAHRLAADRARADTTRPGAAGMVGEEASGPAASVLQAEREQQVHRAIASLPEHHREAVVMHHLEGAPVEEVAEKLGVPLGTVLSRLSRARAALRRKLAGYVESESP
jgi:RNA polymerase sigma-70 factor (ECF subfamily)